MKKREFKLDGFKWLEEESANDADELLEPEELAADMMTELKTVVADLEKVLELLKSEGTKKETPRFRGVGPEMLSPGGYTGNVAQRNVTSTHVDTITR